MKHVIRSLTFIHICTLSTVASAQDMPKGEDIVELLDKGINYVGLFVSLFVIVGAGLALRFVGNTATRLSEQFNTRRLLIQKVESITRFSIYALTALLVAGLSFKRGSLQLVGVVFGVGFGFAMKDVIASVIAGVMIMFDQPFQVGDRVQYAGEYGDIIAIGLRSVRMRTLDDNIVTIPNNKILTDVTSSGNYGALDMQVVIDFYVGADQNLELAERLVREAVLTSRYVFLEKPIVVLISQEIVADMVVIQLRAKGYVLDTKYEKAFQTDVSKRVITAFRDYGVLPPAAFERALRTPEALLAEGVA